MAKRPNPTLVRYIEKHLAKGFHINDIKKKLAEVGHPIEAIEDAAVYVLTSQPKARKKIPKEMVVYGLILIILITGFAYFIWFKATEQIEYADTVEVIKEEANYKGKTDVALLKMAAAGDMHACDFLNGHNLYYACVDRYWEKDDCIYERYIGEWDYCRKNKALEEKNASFCYGLDDTGERGNCIQSVYVKISEDKTPEKCKGNDECLDLSLIDNKDSIDISFCDNYAQLEDKDECIIFFAQKENDVSRCDLVKSPDLVLECNQLFILSVENAAKFCDENIEQIVPADDINSPAAEMLAKNQCFLTLSQGLILEQGVDCNFILEFARSNRNFKFIEDFERFYKDVKNATQDDADAVELMRC